MPIIRRRIAKVVTRAQLVVAEGVAPIIEPWRRSIQLVGMVQPVTHLWRRLDIAEGFNPMRLRGRRIDAPETQAQAEVETRAGAVFGAAGLRAEIEHLGD